jgi:hypothetical protein
VIAPLPLPLAPDTTESHDAFDDAVHVQPAGAVTVAEILLAGMHGLNSTGVTEY